MVSFIEAFIWHFNENTWNNIHESIAYNEWINYNVMERGGGGGRGESFYWTNTHIGIKVKIATFI
jgi:hypothetical protein